MTKINKTLAIVLKKQQLKDRDILVFVFSRDFGKLALIAKNIAKITSKRLSHIDTGNILRIYFYESNNGFYLSDTDLISGLFELKQDKYRIQELYTVLDFIDKHTVANQPEIKVFNMLLDYFKQILQQTAKFESFKADVLKELGFS
ncbi:MAG: hypothetical protein KatS3mg090_0953 [Patescibacteria group bacterium]|nr:MAG: hypothetical protein KatS3mg090_0953 [Patescibacteria group bacterium]